jgi:hypothetical protein
VLAAEGNATGQADSRGACEMIRFLGQRRDFNDRDPAAQIRTLRGIAKDLSSPSGGKLRPHLGDTRGCHAPQRSFVTVSHTRCSRRPASQIKIISVKHVSGARS